LRLLKVVPGGMAFPEVLADDLVDDVDVFFLAATIETSMVSPSSTHNVPGVSLSDTSSPS
jgi:hypothetical protein